MKDIGALRMDMDYTYIDMGNISSAMYLWLCDMKGFGHFGLGGHGIYFESEKDATIFALRWSS